MTRPDCDLLLRLRDGDDSALADLVASFERRLIGYFYGLCGDQQQSEDYAQEVFIRVYRARESYSPDASPATFIFRIAKNYWIDVYRSRKIRPKERSLDAPSAPGEDDGSSMAHAIPDQEPGVGEKLSTNEDTARLREALTKLPEIQRAVLALAGGQGMKYEEISEVLGIPVGTVKSRVHAAVQNLRRLMGSNGGEEGRSGGE